MKPTSRCLFLLLLLVGIHGVSHAQMRPLLKHRVGVPPFDVLKIIMETNDAPGSPPRIPNAHMDRQAPYITWLADADARVESRFILPADSGLLYSVRNLANQLVLGQGALDYGVRHLHTPVLLITGNTDSDAVGLLLADHQALPAAIQADLDHLFVPMSRAPQRPPKKPLTPDQKVRLVVESNIDYQVDRAMDRYQDRIRDDRLVVIGAVLDIANHYGKGKNRLLIININGERDAHTLRRLPLTSNIRPQLKHFFGREPAPR
jgi:carbonic anhydrase